MYHFMIPGGSTSLQPSNALANPFDLTGLDSALDPNDKKSRTAADFLGENANLVNLDMLVTRPSPEGGKWPSWIDSPSTDVWPWDRGMALGQRYGPLVHSITTSIGTILIHSIGMENEI